MTTVFPETLVRYDVDGGTGNPVDNPVTTMPGRNGGRLQRGGSNPNAGRPRTAVRNMLLEEFAEQMPLLKAEIGQPGKITRKEYTELCARFGLGTTISAAEAKADAAPGVTVVRVVYEDEDDA